MDRNDQQAIENLFGKLAGVAQQSPTRDAEAEAFIREQIARQPGAPYYMAQTIVVQEQALNAAQARIEELEREVQARPPAGGLLSEIFGDGRRPSRPAGSVPRIGRPAGAAPQQASPPAGQRAGGGFLAGAAQTAMGVAGGMLLGNMIAGAFGGGEAHAAEPHTEDPEAQGAGFDETGFGDGGFDDFDL